MSRLRRLVLSDRFFFVTCKLFLGRRHLPEDDFGRLADVIRSRRKAHEFLRNTMTVSSIFIGIPSAEG